jgi:hypothetical protein
MPDQSRAPPLHRLEIFPVVLGQQIADVAGYRKTVTGPIVIPTQLSGSMLLTAVDLCPDHPKRIEKRLDGVAAASRIRAPPIGPADFPTAVPPGFILGRPETRGPERLERRRER